MKSFTVNTTPIGIYAKAEKAGFRISGQVHGLTQGNEMTDLTLQVNGQFVTAKVKREEDGTPKSNEKGNYGWRGTFKLLEDGVHYQVNMYVTPVKMAGIMPTNITFRAQVTGDVTPYTPSKEKKAEAPVTKTKQKAAAATETKPTVKAQANPIQSEDDRLSHLLADILAGRR